MTPTSLLDRINQRHPWSHNDHYVPWTARRVAESGAHHLLDIGCGTGNLVATLRRHSIAVTGLERDPATARIAAERFADDPAVTIEQTTFDGRDPRRWDAITLVAALHHLPLVPTLRQLRASLAPGGRLVIVGCFREKGPVDRVAAVPAVLANPVVGLVRHPHRAVAVPEHMTAPTVAPRETVADIRAAVCRELSGARVRRRLFWRYSVVFDNPDR